MTTPLVLSEIDRVRIEEIEGLAAEGAAAAVVLVALLDEPSWPVRRAVVAALARLGEPAIPPLLALLRDGRDGEARIAAAVDALVASSASPEAELVRVGQTAAPALLCDIIQILGRRRTVEAVDPLVRWVRHDDDNVSVCAIEALGRIGGGAGIDAMVEAAASGSFFRVFPAIDALSRSSDPRALPPLERLLADPLCGAEAARALGRRGELDGVTPLAALLVSRSDAMVRIAAIALVAIAERQRERFGTSDAVSEAVRRSAADPSATARRLARSLEGGDPDERASICRLLGWLGDRLAAETLIDLLGDEPAVASAAAGALASLGGAAARAILHALPGADSDRRVLLLPSLPSIPEAAEVVADCLRDPDPGVRAAACEVLARTGGSSVVPALFGALDDEVPSVCQAAVLAIQTLGHAEIEPLAIAAARSPSARVRRAGLRILGYFGWSSALEPLIEALAETDDRLRDAAIHSLAHLDDPRALDALLSTASDGSPGGRPAAMRALGHTRPDARVLTRLELGLADPDPWVRYFACQAIGRLGAPGLLDALVERLVDDAGQVRLAVIGALGRLPGPIPTAALLDAAGAEDAELRRAALLALGVARPPEGLATLLEAIEGSDPVEKVIALHSIAGFDGVVVERTLAATAEDSDPSVRAAAIEALAGRRGQAATATLIALLANEHLRGACEQALATWVPGRIPAILAALETGDADLPTALVAALARMERADARAALGVVLSMDPVASRRAAAGAFVAIGPQSERTLLEHAAEHDSDAEVRRLAMHALARR